MGGGDLAHTIVWCCGRPPTIPSPDLPQAGMHIGSTLQLMAHLSFCDACPCCRSHSGPYPAPARATLSCNIEGQPLQSIPARNGKPLHNCVVQRNEGAMHSTAREGMHFLEHSRAKQLSMRVVHDNVLPFVTGLVTGSELCQII